MRPKTLAVLTNARAADQRSMIGYGELLLKAARDTGYEVMELRASSLLGRLLPGRIQGLPRKFANNIDRLLITPLKFAGKKADVVHVVDPGNVIYLPFIRHRRSLVTVHDMIPYLARDGRIPGWRPSRTGRWLMNRIVSQLGKADHIVCVSYATKRDVISYVGIPEERITVIYNAVFQPMEPASDAACSAFRRRLGLPLKAPLILHVGLNFYKNRETVINVAARVCREMQDARLVMVGALTPALEAQAERLGLGDRLHQIDRVTREDMAALYTTSSVLLFPSLYEGFGLPVLEARMCGTPVVCSDAGSLPEVAGRGATMSSPNDVQALFQGVLASLSQTSEVKDCKKQFLPKALEPLSTNQWFSAYCAVFEKLSLASQRPRQKSPQERDTRRAAPNE